MQQYSRYGYNIRSYFVVAYQLRRTFWLNSRLYTMLVSFFFLMLILLNGVATSASLNSLNGQHLRILWPRWEGNPKGLSGPLKGGVVLEYLSARFNFTYEMVRVTENRLEPPENGRGLFSYLWDNEADLLVTAVLPTSQRLKIVDLTLPWAYDHYAFLIPVNSETANINAVSKPFQWPLWLSLIISIMCVIAVLIIMQRYAVNPKSNQDSKKENVYIYVFGILFSQGGPCKWTRLPFRFVTGAWALAAFVFVQAYTSTLFTYLMVPFNPPLIDSVYDIPKNNEIHLLVKKAGTLDTIFSNTNGSSGLYSKLRDNINSFSESRCNLVSDCIRLITPGSTNVFVDAKNFQLDAIKEEFDKTGKCSMQLAKHPFIGVVASFALPKNSRHSNIISKGVLELQEKGLFDYWDLWFRRMPPKCSDNINESDDRYNSKRQSSDTKKPARISLKNLTGAFMILSVGIGLSVLAFFYELVTSNRNRKKLKNSIEA